MSQSRWERKSRAGLECLRVSHTTMCKETEAGVLCPAVVVRSDMKALCCTKCVLNTIFCILGMMLNNVSTRGPRPRTDLHY